MATSLQPSTPALPLPPVTRLRMLVGCVLVASATGCGGDFAPPSLVETVRVLAIRAQPPFLPTTPSATTTLDAKVVGVGAGQALCHAWGLCLLTTTQAGAFRCADPALQLNLGTTPSVTVDFAQVMTLTLQAQAYAAKLGRSFTGGPPASDNPGAAPESVPVTVLFGVGERDSFPAGCPADIDAFLTTGCVDRERCVIGSKSLRAFTSGLAQHSNPQLTDLKVGGASTTGATVIEAATGALNLAPTWSPDSREARPDDGGAPIEGLLMSWFSTAGAFAKQRSYDAAPSNTLTLGASDDIVTVWVVVRDGRGGVDWLERRLRAK